jgi:hypothetical protein
MRWKNNALSDVTIFSQRSQTCRLRTRTPVKIASDGKDVTVQQPEKGLYVFKVTAGKKYQVTGQ